MVESNRGVTVCGLSSSGLMLSFDHNILLAAARASSPCPSETGLWQESTHVRPSSISLLSTHSVTETKAGFNTQTGFIV